jgi:hypothetical protein
VSVNPFKHIAIAYVNSFNQELFIFLRNRNYVFRVILKIKKCFMFIIKVFVFPKDKNWAFCDAEPEFLNI